MQFGAKYHSFVRPKSLNFPVSFLKFIIPRPHVSGPFFELPLVCLKKVCVFEALNNFVIFWWFWGCMGPIQQVPRILSFCQNVKLRTIGYVRTIQSVYCIGMKDGGGKDGWGWMDGGVDGLMGLGVYRKSCERYDGI